MSKALVEKLKKLDIQNLKINDNLELTHMASGDYYLTGPAGKRVELTKANSADIKAVTDFIASRSTLPPFDEDDFIPKHEIIDEGSDEDLDPFSGDLEDE